MTKDKDRSLVKMSKPYTRTDRPNKWTVGISFRRYATSQYRKNPNVRIEHAADGGGNGGGAPGGDLIIRRIVVSGLFISFAVEQVANHMERIQTKGGYYGGKGTHSIRRKHCSRDLPRSRHRVQGHDTQHLFVGHKVRRVRMAMKWSYVGR
jgi:hypothetical protein